MENPLEAKLKKILDRKYEGSLENYFLKAKEAGMPKEQVEWFLSVGYIPVPSMLPFHASACRIDIDPDEPNSELLGGARGGSKSHSAMMQVAYDCHRTKDWHALFLRKTERAAKTSIEQLIDRTLKYCDHVWSPANNRVTFPNGSYITLGGYNNESDIDAYLSLEFDAISIEELSQLSESKIEKLFGSIRTSKEGYRTHRYFTTNPGGIGHRFVKERFINPWRKGQQTDTRFFPSTYKDNPFLDADYVKWLEGLKGGLGKIWRDGDWDVFEGQAFNFDYNKHVVSQNYDIPEHWTKFRGVDWGSDAPFCCLWGAMNPDNGRYIVYQELYVSKEHGDVALTDVQQAVRILSMTPDYISMTYADPSMWKGGHSQANDKNVSLSTADIYAMNGLYMLKGDNERINGKRRIDRLLADLPDGYPGLLIKENCRNLISQLTELIYKSESEDVDTDMEDHAYDALRYLTTSSIIGRVIEPKKKGRPELSPFEKMLGVKHG